MNIDHILETLNKHGLHFLLIGGMNFMLRHKPILTYDLDVWIADNTENRLSCAAALVALDAEWGATEDVWGPVSRLPTNWIDQQTVYCLSSPHGAIDVFRRVTGLDEWRSSWDHGYDQRTKAGVPFRGLSDEDMIRCQLALEIGQRKQERIQILQDAIRLRKESEEKAT